MINDILKSTQSILKLKIVSLDFEYLLGCFGTNYPMTRGRLSNKMSSPFSELSRFHDNVPEGHHDAAVTMSTWSFPPLPLWLPHLTVFTSIAWASKYVKKSICLMSLSRKACNLKSIVFFPFLDKLLL